MATDPHEPPRPKVDDRDAPPPPANPAEDGDPSVDDGPVTPLSDAADAADRAGADGGTVSLLESAIRHRGNTDYPRFEDCFPKQPIGGSTVRHLVIYSSDFFVVILDNGQFWYEENDGREEDNTPKTTTQPRRDLSSISRAEVLQSLPLCHISQDEAYSYLRMLAQGVVSALYGEADEAKRILDRAENYRSDRSRERAARLFAYSAAGASLGALFLILVGGWLVGLALGVPFSLDFEQSLVAGVCGAFFFSLMNRPRQQFDSEATPLTHFTDAAARIVVGGIAAGVAYAALKSKTILGFIEVKADSYELTMLTLLTCFVAGYSERFVTNIISSVENRPTDAARPPAGSPAAGA